MYDFFKRIDVIIQKNRFPSSNQGLLNGNIGICMFYYHLARKTGSVEFERIADELLEKVYTNMNSLAPPDFENGLAGIGWAIEYLIKNGFAEGDTDLVLEEIDNRVFRTLTEDQNLTFELTNGLSGYLFYLISRLKNLKTPPSIAQRINLELFILTINRLDELVTSQFPSIVKDINFDLFWKFPMVLFGLNAALKLNLYNEKIKCIIKQWLPYFEAYIPSFHINRLILALSLNRLYNQIPDVRLEKQIKILLIATDFNILKTEIDYSFLNVRIGWPGVVLLLNLAKSELCVDSPNYRDIERTYFEIIQEQKYQVDNLLHAEYNLLSDQEGLSFGLAGIGLIELLLPNVLFRERIT